MVSQHLVVTALGSARLGPLCVHSMLARRVLKRPTQTMSTPASTRTLHVPELREAPIASARRIAAALAETAAVRDQLGGTPKRERDLIRESGLLSLAIPTELGGHGSDWPEIFATVRELAKADGSLGHVYGFQHLLLATLRLFGAAQQWRGLFSETATRNWFWGNALNPLDTRTTLTWHGYDGFIDGDKSFCSGALDSDMLIVSAIDSDTQKLVVAAIPTDRPGITLREDWDAFGQRQTDSGSARFERVRVSRHELLASPGPLGSTFASLRPCIAQLVLSNVYLGIAQGAFEAARHFALNHAKAWFASGAAEAGDDPYIQRTFGELWTELEAARALTDEAARALDAAWKRGDALTAEERGEAAIAIALAKVKTTSAGLDTAGRVFEVMGARSTHAKAGLDRYWRNLRVHTLHDPVDYKLRDVGIWALRDVLPTPSFYS